MPSFAALNANTCSSVSGSDSKPTRPAPETNPTIVQKGGSACVFCDVDLSQRLQRRLYVVAPRTGVRGAQEVVAWRTGAYGAGLRRPFGIEISYKTQDNATLSAKLEDEEAVKQTRRSAYVFCRWDGPEPLMTCLSRRCLSHVI